jgi:inosine-uridine nucleoside N-ribohydrolase
MGAFPGERIETLLDANPDEAVLTAGFLQNPMAAYSVTVLSMNILRFFAAFAAVTVLVAAAGGQTVPAAPGHPSEPQLVILDSDIGDDIDDAFALALALRSPELRLLGITTAYGDTELRARLVDRYLAAVGRSDIPVAAGVETPHRSSLTQAAYARQAPERKHADGVEFLLAQIRAHPGEITLIAIGPLSNVQAAIERDPATFRKLKRVVLMGGSVYRGYDDWKTGTRQPASAEWNIKADPAGAKALLAVGVPVFMMPLDSTQIRLETKEREAIFSHGSLLTDQLTLLYHQWMGGNPEHPVAPTLFDPVAVTYAFRPELCPATPIRLEVDDKGFTRPVEGLPNAQVCLKSDEKGFLELLVGRITAQEGR